MLSKENAGISSDSLYHLPSPKKGRPTEQNDTHGVNMTRTKKFVTEA